jgi:hypothetical protein
MQLQPHLKNKPHPYLALIGVKSSPTLHRRLGHPHQPILQHILNNKQLAMSRIREHQPLCVPCQLAKNRQLPFPVSSHVTSTAPLELLHSDVWISPITSISGYKVYVVFI